MIDDRDLLEQALSGFEPEPDLAGRVYRRRDRKRRNQRIRAGALGIAITLAVGWLGVSAARSTSSVPADRSTAPPIVQRANGEVLSFTATDRADVGDLVAVNPETGTQRVLLKDVQGIRSARWSADGRWVAYEVRRSEGGGLWVVGGSGAPRQVATGLSTWMWSSTGAELAAVRRASSSKPLSTIDPETGEVSDVGSIPDDVGDTSAPVWAPDRSKFVFGARGGAIYSVDARSGEVALLVQLPGEHLDSVDQLAWSPDGARLAVMNDLGHGDGRLYVFDADGSNVRVLLDQYVETGIAWSPDGSRLAYQDQSGVIRVDPADGAPPTELGTPIAGPDAGVLFSQSDLAWSPDGFQIALRHIGYRTGGNVVTVSAIDADGQGDASLIEEPTYLSWGGGGWSSCGC